MIKGIYCTNTGLNALQNKMKTLAKNIANVNTEGFRQEKMTFKTLINTNGVSSAGAALDFSPGSIKETGRELDFAINGDAFFTIHTPQGDRYIRRGSFYCDTSGYLTDKNGNRVAGVSGEVRMVRGEPDQDFYLADIQDKGCLTWTVDGFMASDPTQVSRPEAVKVLQGKLETSNVDLIYNLSEMIYSCRNFSLNSRMLMSEDEMLKRAADDIGTLK